MKERHLPEPCRSWNDGLLEVLRPLGRALGRQVTVQAHVGSLHVGALAQAGRCPGHGVRALSLPFGQEAPMRDVRREALVARCSQEKAGHTGFSPLPLALRHGAALPTRTGRPLTYAVTNRQMSFRPIT